MRTWQWHRWFQVSLRSLLLLVLVIAAYFAGVATMLRRVEKAEQARRAAQQEAEAAAAAVRQAKENAMLVAIRWRTLNALEAAERRVREQADTAAPPFVLPKN